MSIKVPHPIAIYYALVFLISWGGDLLVFGRGGIPGNSEQVAALFNVALFVLLAGPCVSGPLLTVLGYGIEGLLEYRTCLLRWRVGTRWYAVTLLTMPALTSIILFALSIYSPKYLPSVVTAADKTSLLTSSIFMGLFGGLLEELGWSGFAVPKLRVRYGVLTTGLIVGFLWGAWHFLITFWSTGSPTGAISMPLLLPPLFFYGVVLPAYRVLMVWVYDRTHSILTMILMHASLIVSTIPAPNGAILPSLEGVPLLTYYYVLAAAIWFLVVAAILAQRRTGNAFGVPRTKIIQKIMDYLPITL